MAQFAIRNSIGSIVDQREAEDAGWAMVHYAVGQGVPSSYLSRIGYRAEEIIMDSKQIVVEGIGFEVWEKSFRVSHDTMTGPIHFLDDDLGTAMSKVADVVKAVRRRQHERYTEALARLSDPTLLE